MQPPTPTNCRLRPHHFDAIDARIGVGDHERLELVALDGGRTPHALEEPAADVVSEEHAQHVLQIALRP